VRRGEHYPWRCSGHHSARDSEIGIDRDVSQRGVLPELPCQAGDLAQNRDSALVATAIRNSHPWLGHLFADSAYAGEKLASVLALLGN
jgi:hypothetical protein